MHRSGLAAALAALIVITGFVMGESAVAAKGDRTARVAGGQQVELAKSRFSTRELAARRAQMEALIPRVR
jgi:hypothetical protein